MYSLHGFEMRKTEHMNYLHGALQLLAMFTDWFIFYTVLKALALETCFPGDWWRQDRLGLKSWDTLHLTGLITGQLC